MPSVIVTRYKGDKEGAPITEPLAASEGALVSRGRKELDDRSLDANEILVTIPYNGAVKMRDVVQVDPHNGKPRRGKVIAIVHTEEGAALVTQLTVKAVIS